MGGSSTLNMLYLLLPLILVAYVQYREVRSCHQVAFPSRRLDSLRKKTVYGPLMKFNFMQKPVY